MSNWSCIHPYIVHWIYYSKIKSLYNGYNLEYNVYNIFMVELGPYVLNPICYILNLINLRQFTIIQQIGYAIEKTRYMCVLVAIQMGFQCH